MILYTPMQMEQVLEGLGNMDSGTLEEMSVGGVQALVQRQGAGTGRIIKLLSTNPHDYMRPELAPGSIVSL